MSTHADKTQENKSQSKAKTVSQKQGGGEPTLQFVDNRPEAVAQKKLQEVANNSLQVKQLRATREIVELPTAEEITSEAPPIQRMIGNGGLANVGRTVKKNGMAGVWKITRARQNAASGAWTYKVDYRNLTQREVTQDDAEWNLFDEEVDPTELRVRQFIAPKIQGAVNGNVNNWLQAGERPSTAISAVIRMDQSRASDGTLRYLWSGGAADCIIIAAFGDAGAFLMHATRVTVDAAITGVSGVGENARVYLSSQYFGLGVESASEAGTVQGIVGSLIEDGVHVNAIFGSGRLAINSRTGEVFSEFPEPTRIDPPEPAKIPLPKGIDPDSRAAFRRLMGDEEDT